MTGEVEEENTEGENTENHHTQEKLIVNLFPFGIVKFLNNLILEKYTEWSKQFQELKTKILNFYSKIIQNPITVKYFDLQDLHQITELFQNSQEDDNFDIEYSIKQLKGRKKSANISFKSEKKAPLTEPTSSFNILDWPEIEIARQLTLHSHMLFSKIEYKELLSSNFTKKDKLTLSPKCL